jgi:PPOX class probable F420-dependent enzyme
MKGQRRGRRIALSKEELDEFLGSERTCRVATISAGGAPHVSPLWFVWDGHSMWLNSVVKSQRWTDLQRDPRVSIVVDDGESYGDLRGVELSGSAKAVGEAPRTGEAIDELNLPERLYGAKYSGGAFHMDGRHAWLCVTPDRMVSWDFRKMVA